MADDVGSMLEGAAADSDTTLDSMPAKDSVESVADSKGEKHLDRSQEALGLLFIGGLLIGYGIGKP